MEEQEIREIANKWFEAFNKHDIDMLIDLYDENAEHYSPKLKLQHPESKGIIKGKAALRQWWKESFEKLPSLKYVPSFFIAEGSSIFMEYKRSVDGEEDMKVGEVLESENGLIIRSGVYHG